MHKKIFALLSIMILLIGCSFFPKTTIAAEPVNVWWPTPGASITGTQPFKALLEGKQLNEYYMFWQVGTGNYVMMQDSQTDYPHKEAQVDLSGWNWNADGNYVITFIAQNLDGSEIAKKSVTIHKDGVTAPAPNPTPTPAPVPAAPLPAPTLAPTLEVPVKDPIKQPVQTMNSTPFYVNSNNPATNQANQWQSSRPADAAIMRAIGEQPTAVWLGEWSGNVQNAVSNVMSSAAAQGKTAVFVAYNIPGRDCGSYSAGGAATKTAYLAWIQQIANGIGSGKAIVILEPDALASMDCLSAPQKTERYDMLSSAVTTLKANANTKVYLDAGHAQWVAASEIATRLTAAGIAKANGFFLNVSNFVGINENVSFGTQVSNLTGGKHFVIDTSRNGVGSNGQWCNPSGRALGQKPTTATGNNLIDAYLWIKTPGESDGNCNGGPSAGTWWPEYALDLAKRAGY